MAKGLDIRRRIRSVKNTKAITKAMEMVAASKMRKAQEAALRSDDGAQVRANAGGVLLQVQRVSIHHKLHP